MEFSKPAGNVGSDGKLNNDGKKFADNKAKPGFDKPKADAGKPMAGGAKPAYAAKPVVR